MTDFWLVRHGDYPLLDHALGGREAHALSATGRDQAQRAAARLGGEAIEAVVSSPVLRAHETAEPIARQLGLAVQVEPGFAEIDFAGWTGVPFAALHADLAWQRWNLFRSTAGVPGGETMLAVQVRAMAAIQKLTTRHPDGAVAVVSHADVIKAVLAHLLGAPLDLLRRLEIGPGSISRISLRPDDACVLMVNLTP